MTARHIGNHAAQNTVSGVVSTGVDWFEEILINDQNGDPLTGVASDTWEFQFSECEGGTVNLALSTSGGTLSVAENSGNTTLTIDCPQASLSSIRGDKYASLVSKPSSGHSVHRAFGIVTFRPSPQAI